MPFGFYTIISRRIFTAFLLKNPAIYLSITVAIFFKLGYNEKRFNDERNFKMNNSVDIAKIIDALDGIKGITVAVFGDFCLDKYLYSHPERDELSVETGLCARQFHRKMTAAGVAGTVTNNLRAMGANVICVGAIGDDGEGFELLRELKKIGADTEHLYIAPDMCTPTYTKPMRKNEKGEYEETDRLDFRSFAPFSKETEDAIISNFEKAIAKADACLCVDQFFQRNTGIVTDGVRDRFIELAKASGKPTLVDSRAFIDEFEGVMIKCNNIELIKYINHGVGDPEDREQVQEIGKKLYERSGQPLFLTRGSEGMLVFDGEGVTSIPAFKVEGPLDICGAGDASSAGIGIGCALGLGYAEAATLACCISSITIQQIGTTGTASPEKVKERLSSRL